MELSEKSFELCVNGQFGNQPLTIDPDETTDGVPLYYCYLDGRPLSQLRHEPAGEWVQIWGDLPSATVQEIGEAIADYMG